MSIEAAIEKEIQELDDKLKWGAISKEEYDQKLKELECDATD